jgi:hypothetical protein
MQSARLASLSAKTKKAITRLRMMARSFLGLAVYIILWLSASR